MWGLLPVLSVCLSAFALAWWLVCGWLAILPLACDLRTTSVPSDFYHRGPCHGWHENINVQVYFSSGPRGATSAGKGVRRAVPGRQARVRAQKQVW